MVEFVETFIPRCRLVTAKLFAQDSSFHAEFNLIENLTRCETSGRNAGRREIWSCHVAHQKDITKNRSQPRGLLRRKLKIQRAEGNFGDEEQEPRAKGWNGLVRVENGNRCRIRSGKR